MYMVFANGVFYAEFSTEYYAKRYIRNVIIGKIHFDPTEDIIQIVKDEF